MRALSPRLQCLLERFRRRYHELGTRVYTEPADAAAFGQILLESFRASTGLPALQRRASSLRAFAEHFPVTTDPDELLVGRQTFNGARSVSSWPGDQLAELGYANTTGHIVHDYGRLVERGVSGLCADVVAARRQTDDPSRLATADAFSETLQAFSRFIRRHDRLELAERPPRTFAEGLQLVWFAQVFLHAENPSMAISFGRLDQYLWPLLRADMAAGRLNEDDAFELVCAFCLKCCEGEESQNLTLGGYDISGSDQSNLLSVLFVEAVEALRCQQPSLTVRVRHGHDCALNAAAYRLAAAGIGQPGFMNDVVVGQALEAVGVAPDRAADWAIVGCYEAVPHGDCYPNTVLGYLHLPELLIDYLTECTASDFGALWQGLVHHMRRAYERELRRLQAAWNQMRDCAPSPFGSVLTGGCIERLLPLEAGGAYHSLVGINILGLGTLVDSLHALRTLVFEQGSVTLPELLAAMCDDFPDDALRLRLRRVPGRYGTDSEETNRLAADLSQLIARMVLDSRLEGSVRPYPAFFRFGADIHDRRVASADGRRVAEPLSYGAGPSSATLTTPTAALCSASHVAHRLCACGNPVALSLPQPLPPTEQAAELIGLLVETYFDLGGQHVHFNTPSAAQLRAARDRPEQHQDLLIRVSGYSTRFVRLDPHWQQALIERAASGV